MRKNQFLKHLKIMVKSKRRVLIERDEEFYYISDGSTLLRLPVVWYESCARCMDVMFIPLEVGEAASRPADKALSDIKPGANPPGLATILARMKANKPVTITGFTFTAPGEKIPCRLVQAAGKPMFYNAEYITAVLDYCGTLEATGDRFPALKWEEADGAACIILPVNAPANAEALDKLRTMLVG